MKLEEVIKQIGYQIQPSQKRMDTTEKALFERLTNKAMNEHSQLEKDRLKVEKLQVFVEAYKKSFDEEDAKYFMRMIKSLEI